MVKLFALTVLYKRADRINTLKAAYDMGSFGFFHRNSALEFMKFSSQIVVERSHVATRASIREQDYMCHVYVRSDSLAGVLISDHEYPHRVAHTLITKVLDDFSSKIPPEHWPNAIEESIPFQGLDVYLAKYQNPVEADAMTKIQANLDETKIILHNTIESVLQRGEKLDDLIAKSEDLSVQSKMFYTTAKKTNSCCYIL